MRLNERSVPYVGRFAPSPTGALHFGSLVTALASALDARAHHGQWLVRLEDLDRARCVAHADQMILHTLEQFGFRWPTPILVQSQQQDAYREAFDLLSAQGLVYPCGCSRKEVEDLGLGTSHACYAGTCRSGMPQGRGVRSWRIRVPEETVVIEDRRAAPLAQALATDVGDFVLRRADGQWSYQLAVVVDDARQGVTDVVRGADLLDSTPRQRYLQRLLGLPALNYLHIPLVLDATGEKLSKHLEAAALESDNVLDTLQRAARHLGLGLIACDSISHFWDSATARWAESMDARNRWRSDANA